MDQFDFRGNPRAAQGLDLSRFIHSQEVREALATGTANKQAEIEAMLARARMNEEAAGQRNAATNEANLAIHRANNDTQELIHLVPKETIAAYNKNMGTNYPEVDMPATTFGGLVQADKQAATDAAKERMWTSRDAANIERTTLSNERIANTQAEVMKYKADKDYQLEQDRQRRLNQGQAKIDAAEANKERDLHQQTAAALMPENVPGDKTTGVKPATDLTSILMTDPNLALQIADELNAGGGLPKGPLARKVNLPSATPPQPSIWQRVRPWGPSNQEMTTQVQDYKTNLPEFYRRAGMAPPTTGHGGASLTKGVPAELAPTTTPTTAPVPAETQQINIGGAGGMVVPQPNQTSTGPTASGPPSSPSTQGYFLYKRGQKIPVSADRYNRYISKYGRPPE
jgi:hypothetical protein